MTGLLAAQNEIAGKYLRYAGFSPSVLDEFEIGPGEPVKGCSWDGANLLSSIVGASDHEVRVHDGFSDTVDTVIDVAAIDTNVTGITFDGTDVYLSGNGTNTLYQLDGLTNTVLDSIPSLFTNPNGIEWVGSELWTCAANGNSSKQDGLTATVLDEFVPPFTNQTGLTANIGGSAITANKGTPGAGSAATHTLHYKFTATVVDEFALLVADTGSSLPGLFEVSWDERLTTPSPATTARRPHMAALTRRRRR